PLTLDPNTAHPCLTLSTDLTSVSNSDEDQDVPDNPERIDLFPCVLGSEGFNSGKHCWDVEYMNSEYSSQSPDQPYTHLTVKVKLQRVRVHLDYDRGK
ncbi:hypothetical protein M9458_029180, partial [Cirrhinus mrigala]